MIRRVRIENFRSIEFADVELHPLTFLVGPNGSGKSNFLDALRFLTELQRDRLDEVLRRRGGPLTWFARKDGSLAESFRIELGMEVDGIDCSYQVEVARGEAGRSEIVQEKGVFGDAGFERGASGHISVLPLVLFNPALVPLRAALSGWSYYTPEPTQIRTGRNTGSGTLLSSDSSNLADVLMQLKTEAPEVFERITEYWQALTDGGIVEARETEARARYLLFRRSAGQGSWLTPDQMSDGSLRYLAILTALFQRSEELSLIAIEEPENNIHPGAAGLLFDALSEASCRIQVIVATHSAELLSRKDLPVECVVAAEMRDGKSVIGPLTEPTREIIRKRLYTVGELLRNDALHAQPVVEK